MCLMWKGYYEYDWERVRDGRSFECIFKSLQIITHRFKTPVTVQKIKVEHSCSHLVVFSSDIGMSFFDVN